MKEPRETTPKRLEILNNLDKKLSKNEITEAEWKKEIRSILLSKA